MKALNSDLFRLLSCQKEPSKVLYPLDQKNTNYCVYFAFAWMLAWNTGEKIPENKIIELAEKLKPWKPHVRIGQLKNLLWKLYNFYTIPEDWTAILEKWWAIQVYLRPTKEFWMDVLDGKLDKETMPGDWLDHSIWLHKVDWKIIARNTWLSIPSFEIKDLDTLRKNWLIAWSGYVVTKHFSQES